MSRRRIELSIIQVASSVLAAVTAAIVASSLGVAGTIIGVAIVSFATTAGTAVYRYYLGRTQERLRSAAAAMGHLATTTAPQTRPGSGLPGTRHATSHGEDAYAGIAHERSKRTVTGPPGAPPAAGPRYGSQRASGQVPDGWAGAGHAAARPVTGHTAARPVTGQPGGPTDETWIITAQAAARRRADAADLGAVAWADGGQSALGAGRGDAPHGSGEDDSPATAAEIAGTDPATAAEIAGTDTDTTAGTAVTDTDARNVTAGAPGVPGDSEATRATTRDGTTPTGGAPDSGAPDSGTPEGLTPEGGTASGGTPGRGGPGEAWLAAVIGWVRTERWVKFAGIAVMIFVLAMGGVTILEAATGKPLDALIWGQHNSGTTVGNVVSGPAHRSRPAPVRPAGTPTPRPAPTRHSPTPTPSSSAPTPTPQATTPTPTAHSPTPTPTATPAATRTPGTTGGPPATP
ncbi:MAG TPA: hypothetical protein VH641_01415 [Streptosporangiaceae bacterium]